MKFTKCQIAKQFNVCEETVNNWIRERGITFAHPHGYWQKIYDRQGWEKRRAIK